MPDDFFTDLVGHLRRRPTPDTLALLLGFASVAEGRLRMEAGAAAESLRRQAAWAPSWADDIGQARFTEAWIATDDFGDQDFIAIGFEHSREGTHGIGALIDHNLGGILKDAMLTAGGADGLVATWRDIPDSGPIREIPAEEASGRLRDALRAHDQTFDPPSTEAVRHLRALFLARLRQLPTPLPRPDPAPVGDGERVDLVAEFLASPHAPSGEHTEYLTRSLVDFKADYADGDMLRWSPTVVEICLLDWFPRKIMLEPDEVAALPDVVRCWVRFIGERRGTPSAGIEATVEAVGTFADEFANAMADDEYAGPAKAIAQAMAADGIDVTDQAAIERWIIDFNESPKGERDSVLGGGGIGIGEAEHEQVQRELLALPPVEGIFEGIDLDALDPDDPDNRSILIRAEHADDEPGLRSEDTDHGAHLAIHEIVANQLWADEPPEVWETAKRLLDLGHEPHVILHMVGYAMSGQIQRMLHDERPFEAEEYRQALAALPDSWLNNIPDD